MFARSLAFARLVVVAQKRSQSNHTATDYVTSVEIELRHGPCSRNSCRTYSPAAESLETSHVSDRGRVRLAPLIVGS